MFKTVNFRKKISDLVSPYSVSLLLSKEAKRTAICLSATVSKQPLNLNRLVQY